MEKRSASIIGVSIIIGCLVLGLLLKSPIEDFSGEINNLANQLSEASQDETKVNRYQMISGSENNIILLDTTTGEYWRKFIDSNKGPTYWEKQSSPIK